MRRMKFFGLVVMMTAACGLPVSAAPRQSDQNQSQSDSVAEAARKARDKKKAATKPSKVITDDDLDKRGFQPGQQGLDVGAPAKLETEPPSTAAVAAAEATDEAAEKESDKKAAEEDAEIARLKLQITQAEKDLDLAQRELALDQDAYFSKPDFANDTAGKARLDTQKQQISDKQQEIEKLKTRLAAMEELKSHRRPSKHAAPAAESEKPAAPAPPRL